MITRQSGIRLAKRLDEVGFSDIVQVRNKVMELRAGGLKVHALHGGEPFFETPEAIKYAAIRALVENQTHYAPSSGVLPLRKALVEKLSSKNGIRDGGGIAGTLCCLSKWARSGRCGTYLLAILDANQRLGDRCPGAASAGAHYYRPPQRDSQNS
jgi:hypothetical protein